ncbi:MAG: hypothetical protein JKY65_25965 [Planctomycetes bacterium]|nr:hypothetical protein [Planctomycetota bacterium]
MIDFNDDGLSPELRALRDEMCDVGTDSMPDEPDRTPELKPVPTADREMPRRIARKWKLGDLQRLWRAREERAVIYRPDLVRAMGDELKRLGLRRKRPSLLYAAILLTRLVYWLPKVKSGRDYVYKTAPEMEAETCLTRDMQRSGRAILEDLGLLKTTRRSGNICHFVVNEEAIFALLYDPPDDAEYEHLFALAQWTEGNPFQGKNPEVPKIPKHYVRSKQFLGEKTTFHVENDSLLGRRPRGEEDTK